MKIPFTSDEMRAWQMGLWQDVFVMVMQEKTDKMDFKPEAVGRLESTVDVCMDLTDRIVERVATSVFAQLGGAEADDPNPEAEADSATDATVEADGD